MKLARYNAKWTADFKQERTELERILGVSACRIEHVGSTSVPGLQAKPIIDIQISVAEIDLPFYQEKLKQLGYRHLPTAQPPVDIYPFFHKPSRWPTTHHIHLCKLGSTEEKALLAFRNWLRSNDKDRAYYGAMKDRLARNVDDDDVTTVFEYTERKTEWIEEVTRKAIDAGMGD